MIREPRPSLSATAHADIETHCFSTTTNEVGGFLVGQVTGQTTEVEAALPARGTVATQVSLTFTHEAWNDALATVKTTFPGKSIVGWYHSHPGFGLFLSEYDAFIQQNFFSGDGQVALVVDPVAGELGWFFWDGSKIVEIDRTSTTRPSAAKPAAGDGLNLAASGVAGSMASSRNRAVLAIAALALGFVLGGAAGWLAGATSSDQDAAAVQAEPDALNAQTQAPSASIAPAPSASAPPSPAPTSTGVTIVYTVQRGDTLTKIARSVLGPSGSPEEIVASNPGIRPDELAVGQQIRIAVPNE